MRENVLGLPAAEIEPCPGGEEFETGFCKLGAAFAHQHGIEPFAQGVQMQDVGGGVGKLRLAQALRAPVARLLLLRQVDIQHLAHQILQAVTIGISAGQPRGDLGAIDRLRHHAEGVVERREVEARKVEYLGDRRIGQQRLQVRRVALTLRDLDDIGTAVAVRHLHHAEPVAMRMEAHGLGIDRYRVGVARNIGQVAAMQADGHEEGLRSQVEPT